MSPAADVATATIAHISDLHFGAETPAIVEGLVSDLREIKPTLVVASGDLTQRARNQEFADARRFLDRLDAPRLAVPGNHDIPLFDVFHRFFRPLARYHRHIDADENPFRLAGNVAILGINTARSNTWKDGRVGTDQIAAIRSRFASVSDDCLKILVTHHPFLPPPGDASPPLVGRANEALRAAEEAGVDLMLAGHLHHGYTGDIRAHHEHIRRPILVAQAGTATSHRVRNEPNSYNVIRWTGARLTFSLRHWESGRFKEIRSTAYVKNGKDWELAANP